MWVNANCVISKNTRKTLHATKIVQLNIGKGLERQIKGTFSYHSLKMFLLSKYSCMKPFSVQKSEQNPAKFFTK